VNGVNYWKPHFSDLNIFDTISLHELLYRIYSTLLEFGQWETGNLVYYNKKYKNIKVMQDLYLKFNKIGNNHQICLYPNGQPLFRNKYTDKQIGSTCNYQWRDLAIKPPFEHLCLYEHYFVPLINDEIEKNFLYLTIPNDVIVNYMHSTSNIDDDGNYWSMEISRKFISEIKDWNDLQEIENKIDEFDKKYLNWNWDFPILGFRTMLQNGLVFPNTNFFTTKFLVNGMHRLFMCGMSGNDYPILTQIPRNKKQFSLQSVGNNFKNSNGMDSFLIVNFDLDKKTYQLTLDDNTGGTNQIISEIIL